MTAVRLKSAGRNSHRFYALTPSSWRVGYVVAVQEPGVRGKLRTRWAAQVSPMAFAYPKVTAPVPRELYAPSGSDLLPGRHVTKDAAADELWAYLETVGAPALDGAL